MNKLIRSLDREKIKAEVARAEKKTIGEVIPLVVLSSSEGLWVMPLFSLLGVLIGLLWAEGIHLTSPFPLEFRDAFRIILSCGAVGTLLSYFPWIKRRAIGSERLAKQVHDRAIREFVEHGLVETQARTGVLIFVSIFERRVEVLGDRGIHSKCGNEYWKEISVELARSIGEGKLNEGLIRAIGKIGEALGEHFPKTKGNPNELSDDLRTEE